MRDYALILANDVQVPATMLSITRDAKPHLDGVKIGITSSMKPGTGIFKEVREIMGVEDPDKFVIADYKVADVGFKNREGEWEGTNAKIIEGLADEGVDYVICHTFPALSSIQECVEVGHKHGVGILTLPSMTNKGAQLFFGMPLGLEQRSHIMEELEAYGIGHDDNEVLYRWVEKANTISDAISILGHHFGVDGYIGPANKLNVLERYRKFIGDDRIWSPGFGRQDTEGRSLEQQVEGWARIVGPNSSMIVGSLIYRAESPREAAKEVMETRDRVISRL